ncbi:MAG: hypothetical protein ACREXY_08335 [Gammaproteobacteria bacterium]
MSVCLCGGVLHSARYPRKPRGGPRGLGPEYETRLSFCCAKEGCRRRTTPPSVRFLGQRVYLGAVIVVWVMEGGVTAKRAERLRELLGVSLRTLKRWRKWWREVFKTSPFWKQAMGHFAPPVDGAMFPASLFERFMGHEVRDRLARLLRFLSPLTTRSQNGLVDARS